MVRKISTKELLVQSLYELLEIQSFEQITVRAIAAHCGLSQRTFYNHFRDKHDLLDWSYMHVLEDYYTGHRNGLTLTEWYRISAETVWEQRTILRKANQYQGQNTIRISLQDPYAESFYRIIREVYQDPVTEDIRIAVRFMVGGMIRFVEEAVARPEVPTPEQAVYLFRLCTPSCLQKYL